MHTIQSVLEQGQHFPDTDKRRFVVGGVQNANGDVWHTIGLLFTLRKLQQAG